MPNAAKEVKPHPYGVDVETIQRITRATETEDMASFMTTHFHRVGVKIAEKFLKEANIDPDLDPKELASHDIVNLVHHLKSFKEFLPPDASCLSPLGEELLEKGVRKELNPEFVAVDQRKPAAYSGFSFIVETAIAYGGEVQKPGIELFRFANRIPLLYDEASDVSWKVINSLINWRHYKIAPEVPIALIVHLCSTKIPYKSVGKEFIADRPEVEREILNSIRELARKLSLFISRRASVEREKEKLDIFAKYMPKIARFSTKLADKSKEPDIAPLIRNITKYGSED
jgi:DNA topoisomerase-6 subunit B